MTEDLKEKVLTIMTDLPTAVSQGLIHPEYRHDDPLLPEPMIGAMIGAHAYAQGAITFRESFPDQRTEPIWILQEGDMTASRWRFRGTFTGKEFFGRRPNGRVVEFVGMTMYRWRDGQVVEGMSLYDIVGFERQLDAPPADE